MKYLGWFLMTSIAAGCGTEQINRRGEKINPARSSANQKAPGVVRGRWEVKLGSP
jgi:hypothetical protein